MSAVVAHMTMSLDGFIADDHDEVGALFDWYDAGAVEVRSADPGITFHLDEAGAAMMRSMLDRVGAVVSGRRLFDITRGWGDRHPIGAPVVVVTHAPPEDARSWPSTTFVSGVADAVRTAASIAGGKDVVIASADIVGQALDLGLVDEVAVSVAPLLMGRGRSYFGSLHRSVRLDDPAVTAGTRATHLRYRVGDADRTGASGGAAS